VIPVVYTYLSRRVFMEADLEGATEAAVALPSGKRLEPAE
jgi:hypothetical protein